MPRQITPEALRRIRRLAQSGHTTTQIARDVGCDRHTVARHLQPGNSARRGGAEACLLTTDERVWLRALVPSLRATRCVPCGKQFLALKSMTTGVCEHCGTELRAVVAAA